MSAKLWTLINLIFATFFIIVVFRITNRSSESSPFAMLTYAAAPNHRVSKTYEEWRECISNKIKEHDYIEQAELLWANITKKISNCSESVTGMKKLRLIGVDNREEIKYHILPNTSEPVSSVVLTLGVGKNIIGELNLQEQLHNSSRFYGADPIIEYNRELFAKVGPFFPFAVSAEGGMKTASVLINENYVNQVVVHVDIVYFMGTILQEKFFDAIWMDNEYAEYDLLPFFYKGGQLDQAGIIVCQLNVEIHVPRIKRNLLQFHQAIFQLIEDGVYAIVKCVDAAHLRLYLVNFRDDTCIDRYLKEIEN